MLRDNPFDIAAYEGARLGVCPVLQLDDFFTNHAVFEDLCAEFKCKECVAALEDMGIFPPDPDKEQEESTINEEGDCEIPF